MRRLQALDWSGVAMVEYRYDADTDHPWHRLERGEIDLAAGFTAGVTAAVLALRLRDGMNLPLAIAGWWWWRTPTTSASSRSSVPMC